MTLTPRGTIRSSGDLLSSTGRANRMPPTSPAKRANSNRRLLNSTSSKLSMQATQPTSNSMDGAAPPGPSQTPGTAGAVPRCASASAPPSRQPVPSSYYAAGATSGAMTATAGTPSLPLPLQRTGLNDLSRPKTTVISRVVHPAVSLGTLDVSDLSLLRVKLKSSSCAHAGGLMLMRPRQLQPPEQFSVPTAAPAGFGEVLHVVPDGSADVPGGDA